MAIWSCTARSTPKQAPSVTLDVADSESGTALGTQSGG